MRGAPGTVIHVVCGSNGCRRDPRCCAAPGRRVPDGRPLQVKWVAGIEALLGYPQPGRAPPLIQNIGALRLERPFRIVSLIEFLGTSV
jgi:hypothetical protein